MKVDSNKLHDIGPRIRAICLNLIDEYKWNSFDDIDIIEEENSTSAVGAYISMYDRRIHITYAKDLYDTSCQFLRDKKIDLSYNDFENLLFSMLVKHEYGHHQICPRTKEGFETITSGAYEALRTRTYSVQETEMMCANVHNMVSDLILDTVRSRSENEGLKYADGHALAAIYSNYYQRMKMKKGMKWKILAPLKIPRIDEAMTIFLYTSMYMTGCDKKYQEIIRPMTKWVFASRGRYVEKAITIFTGDEDTTKRIMWSEVTEKEWKQLCKRIKDESLWKQMGYDYAILMYYFMKRRYGECSSSYTQSQQSSGKPSNQQSSRGQKSKPSEDKNQKKDQSDGDQERKNEEEQKDKENIEREKEEKQSDIKNSEDDKDEKKSSPVKEMMDKIDSNDPKKFSNPILKHFSYLDNVYKKRAGIMSLYGEEEKSGLGYDHLVGKDETNLTEINHSQMDWASTRIYTKDNQKSFEFYQRDTPLSINAEIEESNKGIPDLAFVLDSSLSMTFDPMKGVGEYHHALLAFYSILKFLESQNLAHLINYLGMNFSQKTITSEWCEYDKLIDVKKALFSYQGHGTSLDLKVFSQIRKQRQANCIVFMLSDTFFNFERNVKELYEELDLIKKDSGIGFYLFQMGNESPVSLYCRGMGLPVHPVRNAKDFMNKSIAFTKDLYGELA